MPILQAIATSVAPPKPTIDQTAAFTQMLPACDVKTVTVGDLCAPIYTKIYECTTNEQVYVRAQGIPCKKRDEQ
jgi:hypothetical protein